MGRAIAEIFAVNGYSLFLTARNDHQLYQTMDELMTSYSSAVIKAKPFDLSTKEGATACGEWMLEMGTVPDILVNNAGFYQPGNIQDEPEGSLEKQLAINLYSSYHLTRALLPGMIERKSGHIFNICSIAALKAYPGGGSYSISKFALNGFSTNLREELKPHGIKVTTVFPGAVFTDSWAGFDNSTGRIMEVNDIAQMVFTASRLTPQACVEEIVIRPQLGDV